MSRAASRVAAAVVAAVTMGCEQAPGAVDAPETAPAPLQTPLTPEGWLGGQIADPAALPGCRDAWTQNKKPWGAYRSWHCRAVEALPAGWPGPANVILDLEEDRVLAIKLGLRGPAPVLEKCEAAPGEGGWRSCAGGRWWARAEPVPGGTMLDMVHDLPRWRRMQRELEPQVDAASSR